MGVSLRDLLGLEHVVVQAGMGGGIATAELAGAVSAAGGLGTVGMLDPAPLRHEIGKAHEIAAGKPVAANLLVPFARRAHAEACIGARCQIVMLHAGFDAGLVARLRDAGIFVLHQVGTPAQARRAIADGADGLIAQGWDAGGHLVGVRTARETLEAVRVAAGGRPVLVAGGVATASDVRTLMDLGADGVVAGTRFLLTREARAHDLYKERVLSATRTLETLLFGFGWYMRHRVVPNAATERWCRRDPRGPAVGRAMARASGPLKKILPMHVAGRVLALQRPSRPVFSPSPPLRGASDELVDAAALYAGESALRIDGVVDASEAVALLAVGLG